MEGLLTPAHIILIIAIILAVRIYTRGSGFRAWLQRIAERSAFREQRADRSRITPRLRWIPFPRALATALFASVAYSGSLASILSMGGYVTSPFNFEDAKYHVAIGFSLALIVSGLMGVSSSLYAIYLHFRPGHDRRVKYDWFLAGVSVVSAFYILKYIEWLVLWDSPGNVSALEGYTITITFNTKLVMLIAVLLNPALLIFAFGLTLELWGRRLGRLPLRRLLRPLAILRLPGMTLFAAALAHPIWMIYLWLRYTILERFSASPILYLRSFRFADTATAYGRVVARAARPFGIVVAIVHEAQTGSTLMRFTSPLDQPQVAHPTDDAWQDWVRRQLATASVVLVDATVLTENVTWEIDSARSIVAPSRIAVLVECGAKVATPEGVATIEYALDDKSVRDAVARLKIWLANALRENLSVSIAV
jgi:hypothetical protein